MPPILLVALPLAAALLALLVPSERARALLVPATGAVHLALTAAALLGRTELSADEWLALDGLGALFLGLVSGLFFLAALYVPGYLALRPDRPNRVFCVGLFGFLGGATLLVLSQHVGLMWVAIEATTLATGPLIYFNRNARSIEATWKYLMIGSVGIALALLGSLFLAYAAYLGKHDASLLFQSLLSDAPSLSRPWVRAAFVFLLVGYGTKMGVAPLHNWKPDAYGEAPGVVGMLLSGGMTSASYLALLRVYRVVAAAGEGAFARELMVVLGVLSLVTAAVFLVRQRDLKRLLAYSSVEHMGLLLLGTGIGGAGFFGALLHAVNNAFTKGVLFLSAGNLHRAFGGKTLDEVKGALRVLPVSGGLFLAGFFAVTGSPPFGPFLSELTILSAAFSAKRFLLGASVLLLLATIFLGMGATVLAALQGPPPERLEARAYRDGWPHTLPIVLCLLVVLLLGVHVPAPLRALLTSAAADLAIGGPR